MTTSGPGLYFDGATSARHDVTVELGAAALRICASDGALRAEWPYAEVASFSAPDGVLRLGRTGSPLSARLEIRNRELAAAFNQQAGTVERVGAIDRRTSAKVVGWSLAAVVSAVIVAVFGVPAMVKRIAPLVPLRIEQRLGTSIDGQLRTLLARGRPERFECGDTAATRAGRAAFGKLVRRLETAAALPFPVNANVVRRSEANAISLPGGRIYVFRGLIDKAENPDELAGVVAHEMGHIAHRDGVRAVIQAAGLSFLFGMLIGDFSGGGAAVIAMRTVLQSSYSRATEAAADAYGAALVTKLGRDPRALGDILVRIAGAPGPMAKILLDHPEARERAAAIAALAGPRSAPPATPSVTTAPGAPADASASAGTAAEKSDNALLDAAEWASLKRICDGGSSPTAIGK